MKKQWQFSHTETTKAKPSNIWRRWTDVEHWPQEDTNLKSARLEGEFAVGSKIVMVPTVGPKSTVTITEVTNNKSFSTEGNIPFGKLIITHSIKQVSGKTRFKHTIKVTGPFRKFFVRMVVQRLADNLPQKMRNIAKLAEKA